MNPNGINVEMRDLVRPELVSSIDPIVAIEFIVVAFGKVNFWDAVSINVLPVVGSSNFAIIYGGIKGQVPSTETSVL